MPLTEKAIVLFDPSLDETLSPDLHVDPNSAGIGDRTGFLVADCRDAMGDDLLENSRPPNWIQLMNPPVDVGLIGTDRFGNPTSYIHLGTYHP